MEWRFQREAIIAGLSLILVCSPPSPSGRAEEPAPPSSATSSSSPSDSKKDDNSKKDDGGKPDASPGSNATSGADKDKTGAPGDSTGSSGDAASPPSDGNSKDGDGKDPSVKVKELKAGERTGTPPKAPPLPGGAGTRARTSSKGHGAPAKPKKKDLARILGPLPRRHIGMDFRGMDIDNVLLQFSTWAGITIVKDPGLTGPVNLIQGQEVPLLDAFRILEAVLNQKGYTIDREGPILKVVPKPSEAPAGPPPGGPPAGPPAEAPKPPEDKITKIFKITYASAQSVARIVNELFGAGGGGQPQPGQPGGPGGPPGPPPGAPAPGGPGGAAGGKKTAQVKATADFDTNQVVVTGDPVLMDDVTKVIADLDKKTDIPLETRTWEIQYAEVNDVANQVAAVLASISGTGRTSAFQDVPFERRVLGGGGGYDPFGGSRSGPVTAAGGRVISDPRTNKLTVIAAPEQLDQIDKVIKALDQKVEYASTTFILPLKHLEASEATFVLGQLFQRQQNENPFGFFFFGGGGNNQQNQVRQRRRLGDPQSARPSPGSRTNTSPFGFSSDDGSLSPPSGGDVAAAAAATATSTARAQAQGMDLTNPQASAPTVQADVSSGGAPFPIPTSVTLDGAQLAQWWNQNQNSTPLTGRDETGRVRPLVDLQGKITIVPDLNTNGLIVNTNPSNLEALKRVLALIDQQPSQVLIEGIIVEASLDSSTKLGVTFNWTESPAFNSKGAAQKTTISLPTTNPQGGVTFTALGNNFDAIAQAVKTDQRFNVLSTPRIMTQNNRQAAITIGESVPILNVTTSFGNQASSIDYKNVGVVLDVTPHVTADGYVNIEVGQDADEISGFTSLNNNQVPIISRRSTETTVSVRDGQTIVLGGLIRNSTQNNHTKIPILGDLPLIGSLFRSQDKTKSKTELMIFLRASIVRYDDEVDDLTRQQAEEGAIKPDSLAGKHINLPKPSNAPSEPPGKAPQTGKSGPLPPITDGPL